MAQDKQAALDALNTAIDAIISGGAVQEYTINGRSVSKTPLPDLFKYRDQLTREIAVAAGNPRAFVKFGRVS